MTRGGRWIVMVAVAVGGCMSKPEGGVKAGDRAPEFSVKALDGKRSVSLKDFKGKKAVVVNLFNTWCPPCRVETPDLVKAYHAYRTRGIEFVSICTPWNGDTAEAAGKFAEEYHIPWTMAFDAGGTATKAFQVRGVPTNCVVGEDGKILFTLAGALEEKDLAAILEAVLAGKPIPKVYP